MKWIGHNPHALGEQDAESKIRASFGGFTSTMQNALNPRMTSGFRGNPKDGGIQGGGGGDGDGGEEKKKQKDAKKNKQLVGDGADASDRSESA